MRKIETNEITRDTLWRTKEGAIVALGAMKNSHLLNCIRALRGYSPHGTTIKMTDVRRRAWLNALANEAYSRGLAIDEVREGDPVHE